ncbi:rRNA processing protein [Stygiomarasmius scandens]|uniref:Pre-rRNA-processing protein n=1 Tax=Marasmiellus scandens TaxID=2682957 RepID=A0ABR1JWZ5_9AGAR
MPKSSKKRKDKAADFTKAKLKLGKGKQAPSNVIDTSFKARSIALPSQSISVVRDDDTPTTRRRLTFEDLISNLKHHNAGSRRDAAFGLKELLDGHWQLAEEVLPTLLNATIKLISDEDVSVRKALITLFSWLLPRVSRDIITPHAPLLLLFTTSAQTHIFPEIRVDAVRLLNVMLEYIPEIIVSGWDCNDTHGSRMLEGYLGILNAGTLTGDAEGPPTATSTATVMLSLGSKLVVLQSLSRFLEIALSSTSNTNQSRSWFLSSAFSTLQAYHEFDNLIQPSSSKKPEHCHDWSIDAENDFLDVGSSKLAPSGWDLQDLSTAPELQTFEDDANPFIARLARTLHSTLISAFLDCAPTVFSPSLSPPETEMDVIVAVTQIIHTLYGWMFTGSEPLSPGSVEELKAILGHMSPFFPFSPSGRRDIKIENAFQDLNLKYCDLLSRLVLYSQSSTDKSTARTGKGVTSNVHQLNTHERLWAQSERVCDYIVKLLGGNEPEHHLTRPLSSASYNLLLPAIWSLMNLSHQRKVTETSVNVWQATLKHSSTLSSKSALKRSTSDFVARIVLLETDAQYRGDFRLGRNEENTLLDTWVTHLPKVLWELGSSNESVSETILLFLLRLIQRRSQIVQDKTLSALQTRFVPYFSVTHAVRGQIPGPYTKLSRAGPAPSRPRRLALDLAILLLQQSGVSNAALIEAVELVVKDTAEEDYWCQLKMHILSM